VIRALVLLLLLIAAPALAQDRGTLQPKDLPSLKNPADPNNVAKEVFGRAKDSAPGKPEVVGFYSKGCLQGGIALPLDGPNWQVMRPSRNRFWGHPDLVTFLQTVSTRVPQETGRAGLLVGDMAQPRGGPMLTGHASHQSGLDADLWLMPMPARRFTRVEREELPATNIVRADWLDVDRTVWSQDTIAFLRLLAREKRVERLFVNAAIKKALCRDVQDDRSWLSKVRPMWGHNYHVHVRLTCPADAPDCAPQDKPPPGDGCDASLDWWFTDEALNPKPGKPRPPLRMADMPPACRRIAID
jgi:penicillin-insensitive murein endopeptidase